MAEKENKSGYGVFLTSSIVTLVIILLLFILALFNQHEVMFSLFGYRHKEVSMYWVVGWSFAAGALYMGILWALYGIKNFMTIKSLKKTILELKEKLNPGDF